MAGANFTGTLATPPKAAAARPPADTVDTAGVVPTMRGPALIHNSEPTRLRRNTYAVLCLKKKKTQTHKHTQPTTKNTNNTKTKTNTKHKPKTKQHTHRTNNAPTLIYRISLEV